MIAAPFFPDSLNSFRLLNCRALSLVDADGSLRLISLPSHPLFPNPVSLPDPLIQSSTGIAALPPFFPSRWPLRKIGRRKGRIFQLPLVFSYTSIFSTTRSWTPFIPDPFLTLERPTFVFLAPCLQPSPPTIFSLPFLPFPPFLVAHRTSYLPPLHLLFVARSFFPPAVDLSWTVDEIAGMISLFFLFFFTYPFSPVSEIQVLSPPQVSIRHISFFLPLGSGERLLCSVTPKYVTVEPSFLFFSQHSIQGFRRLFPVGSSFFR